MALEVGGSSPLGHPKILHSTNGGAPVVAARIATSGVTRGWCLAMSELGNGLGVAGTVQGSSDIFEASRESRTPAGETIEDRAVR